MRRLPIYFLVDTSESMDGEPIENVKNGIQFILDSFLQSFNALETVYVSLITFDNVANQLTPLKDLVSFKMNDIKIKKNSLPSLNAGFNLLRNIIENEVNKNTTEFKGDWQPIVFLMTNVYLCKIEEFQMELNNYKLINQCKLIVCVTSNKADIYLLNNISNEIIELSGSSMLDIKKYINWKNQGGEIESSFNLENPSQFMHLLLIFIWIIIILVSILKFI
jgi:uncharacterized protein YegL